VYPTSLICDTYSDFRELPASGISAEQVPGSVRLESYIGPVLVDRPNRIERKAENLLVYENTNGGCGNSRADFESKDYNYGPAHVANVHGGGNSIINNRGDYYAHKFIGYVFAPEDGTYTFATDSDDGSDLSINGTVVCSFYGCHGTGGWHTGTISLTKGWHEFIYYQSENTGGAAWRAGWQKPGDTSISYIPESNLAGSLSSSWVYEIGEVFKEEGFIIGTFDAERSVEWGQYKIETTSSYPDIAFRASEIYPIPSGRPWVSPSGDYVFPEPSGGRYLEWKAYFDEPEEKIDALIVYPWRNKFFKYTEEEDVTTYSSDAVINVQEDTYAEINIWGAGGAGGTPGGWSYGSQGGAGSSVKGTMILKPGINYHIKVGGPGVVNSFAYANGGGGRASNNDSDNRYSGGGGGYSGIFKDDETHENVIMIAGAGRGGGSSRAGRGNI
jgi:hypothetical protein